MRKQGKRRIGECAYCGNLREVSHEHVIPECLFVRPYPPNLITVPACDSCNGKKSEDDDFLRDFLAVDFQGSQSPVAQRLFTGEVQRSLSRNSSHLLRSVLPKLRIEPLYTDAGIYLGDLPQAPFDGDRLNRLLGMIVRGLYFDARRVRLSGEYRVEVRRAEPWAYKQVMDVFRQLHPNGPRALGNVFSCIYVAATEDLFTTMWALWFYERVLFTAITEPPAAEAPSPNKPMHPTAASEPFGQGATAAPMAAAGDGRR